MSFLQGRARSAPSAVVPLVLVEDSLLAEVIGDRGDAGEKGACRIARLIEETLIVKGWPTGTFCGSEQALAEAFGVGRAMIREAVRILEMRGTARMVRGPGGGLRVLEIDARRAVDFVIGFGLFEGVTPQQLAEAEVTLQRVRRYLEARPRRASDAADPTTALDFFGLVVSTLKGLVTLSADEAVRPSTLLGPEILQRSRAGQVVGALLGECTAQQWAAGRKLGSEDDLCDRYGVDRGAFRQAVRILESAGAAEAFCGRGHGLVSQAPRRGAVARLVSCYFASSGMSPQAVMRVFQRLNVNILALAAAKASPASCERVTCSLSLLEEALDQRDTASIPERMFNAEEAMISVADNPVLQLFVHSLRGYPSARIPRDLPMLDAMNRTFLRLSHPVLDALRRNDTRAAGAAQQARADGLSALMMPVRAQASGVEMRTS